jgi:hypothetical protein
MFLVARCTFCEKRHLLEIDELDIWYTLCSCGANGFVMDEVELTANRFEGVGFTVQEVATSSGLRILLSDPIPIFVDRLGNKFFVCWCKPMEESLVVIC